MLLLMLGEWLDGRRFHRRRRGDEHLCDGKRSRDRGGLRGDGPKMHDHHVGAAATAVLQPIGQGSGRPCCRCCRVLLLRGSRFLLKRYNAFHDCFLNEGEKKNSGVIKNTKRGVDCRREGGGE